MESKEREYYVLLDKQVEYIIKERTNKKGNRVIRLFYSESEFWNSSIRNTEALKMVDNGNGVKLSKPLKKMDYSDVEQIRLLLSFAKATDENLIERNSMYEIYPRISETLDVNAGNILSL